MNRQEKLLSLIGLAVLGAIVAIAFRAYLSPGMLIELGNLLLCH